MKTKASLFKVLTVLLCMLLLFSGCSNTGTQGESPESSSEDIGGSTSPDESGSESAGSNTPDSPSWTPVIEVTGDTYPLTVRDAFDYETVLEEAPTRVAVISGTPLNIWYDLGGKSVCTSTISANLKVVAEYEEEIRALPSVGRVTSVDIESIISYEPDLIIAQKTSQEDAIEALRGMGYKVITTYVKQYTDVIDTYRAFGKILGASDAAEAKIAELESAYNALLSLAPEEGKTVVILYLTSKSLQVKLDTSIAGAVAADLGLVNIATGLSPIEEGSENTTLDIEYLIEKQPDIILVTSMISDNATAISTMEANLESNSAWKGVAAAQNGNIVYLPQEYFLYNAGPYYTEAVRYIACSVYPDVYGDVSEWYGN